jgi:sarcosine oxidase subunit alpha
MLPARDGLRVEADGPSAASRFDPYRAIDRLGFLFPLGFQYRYFKRQTFAWRAWERRLRAVAAESPVPPPFEVPPAERMSADLLVVGSGPAGLGVAAAAGRAGLRVVLTGRSAELGGRIKHALRAGSAPPPVLAAREYVRHAGNVTCVAPGTVVAAFGERFLVDRRERILEVTAPMSVLATGAYERALTFPDNDRPGVMLTSALRRLVLDDGVRIAGEVVIVTRDDSAHAAADELRAAGVRVAAVLDQRAGARFEGIVGRRRVTALRCEADGVRRTIPCGIVAMSGGWQPADELRYQATSHGTDLVAGERARPLDPAEKRLSLLHGVGAVAGATTAGRAFAEGSVAGALAAVGAGRAEGNAALDEALEHLRRSES